jgi:hypothetical protein
MLVIAGYKSAVFLGVSWSEVVVSTKAYSMRRSDSSLAGSPLRGVPARRLTASQPSGSGTPVVDIKPVGNRHALTSLYYHSDKFDSGTCAARGQKKDRTEVRSVGPGKEDTNQK